MREGIRLLGVSFRPGEMAAASNLVVSPPPGYPPEARDRGIEGKVSLLVQIDATGRVEEATLATGDPKLAEAGKPGPTGTG